MTDKPSIDPRKHGQSGLPSGVATLLACGAGFAAGLAAYRAVARSRRAITLAGKTAVITGGSRGLGLIVARKLALAGARICIIGRDGDSLARAKANILKSGDVESGNVNIVVADVSEKEQLQNALETALEKFGRSIDILINNAGMIQVGPMETMTDADYDEAMRTHFWAPYYAIQKVLPGMRLAGGGRIVNIASVGGKISVPHLLPYSASKFALVGLSEGLRSELIKDKIYVTTVCPGLMRTGSPRNALFKGKHHDEYAWFTLSDSLPFLSTNAERCAEAVISALRFGDAEVITSLVAQAGVIAHGLFPSLVIDALGEVNRLLPAPGDSGTERFSGAESEGPLTQSNLTFLTRRAELDNNQV